MQRYRSEYEVHAIITGIFGSIAADAEIVLSSVDQRELRAYDRQGQRCDPSARMLTVGSSTVEGGMMFVDQPDRSSDSRDPNNMSRSIATDEIFRSLIDEELRNGRLTPARRRRIVRYATAMGLSATEAGDLITESRDRAIEHPDPMIRTHALRVVYPEPPLIPAGVKMTVAVIVAIALDLLLVVALFR